MANNYLDPGGLFLFDCNTTYKYEVLLADNTFAENRDEGSFIWENYYDKETGINQYDLTLYIKSGDGRYERFEETHLQRNYSLEVIRRLMQEAGLVPVAVYDAYTLEPPKKESERLTIVARESGK